MKRITPMVICAAALLLAGCAAQRDMDSVKRDLEEAKGRIVRVERDVSVVRTEVKDEVGKQLAGTQEELSSVRRLGADLQAALDASKVDSQVLSGKVDDLANQTRKPADDIALLREDTEQRLTALNGRIASLEKGMAELQKQSAEAKTSAEAPQTPEALYQKALETYRGGNMTKAREEFSAFLEKNPKHELAANANYWLGESYYGEKRYDQAVLAFQEVIKNFPTREKAPAALLKQGMAFKEMGDAKSARFVYRKLLDEYPKAEEAAKAREKLKELK
jgi:tol-pal system protein YbgF